MPNHLYDNQNQTRAVKFLQFDDQIDAKHEGAAWPQCSRRETIETSHRTVWTMPIIGMANSINCFEQLTMVYEVGFTDLRLIRQDAEAADNKTYNQERTQETIGG